MTYDGTITVADPLLVEVLYGMPDGVRAYVRVDVDADAPDWDGLGYVYRIGYDDNGRADSTIIAGDGRESAPTITVGTVREAWDRLRDWTTVGRYLRVFHDVVSFDWTSSADRDGTLVGCVTRAHVEWWGVMPSEVPDLAGEALAVAEDWTAGRVYGVTVVDDTTGEERDVWGVYDSTADGRYLREVARDLLDEIRDRD